jgi:hypothetical protein
MAGPQELTGKFSLLESKIQKLIHLHQELKNSNLQLLAENRQLNLALDEEKDKIRRLEEGYRNLKEMESNSNRQSITQMKRKINDIITEIDRNVSILDEK